MTNKVGYTIKPKQSSNQHTHTHTHTHTNIHTLTHLGFNPRSSHAKGSKMVPKENFLKCLDQLKTRWNICIAFLRLIFFKAIVLFTVPSCVVKYSFSLITF